MNEVSTKSIENLLEKLPLCKSFNLKFGNRTNQKPHIKLVPKEFSRSTEIFNQITILFKLNSARHS